MSASNAATEKLNRCTGFEIAWGAWASLEPGLLDGGVTGEVILSTVILTVPRLNTCSNSIYYLHRNTRSSSSSSIFSSSRNINRGISLHCLRTRGEKQKCLQMCLFSLSLSLPLSLARQHDSRIDESKNRRKKISISSGSRRFFFFPLLLFAIKVTEYPSKKLRCVSDTYLTGEPLIDGSMDQPAN